MPISPEALEFIAQFGAFGVAMLWVWALQKQISDLKVELRDSRLETKQARDRHEADLRDWSGIDPKFNTWAKVNAESDTKLRLRMEERERLREHVDKLEPPK